jgi:hypothetical protein
VSLNIRSSNARPQLPLSNSKIKPTLDPQSLSFLKSISCLSRVGPNWVNPHLEAFFRVDVSPPQSSAIEAPEVPLFPRRRLPGSKNADALPDGFASIADLPILVPRAEQESEISDLYKEHMVIVNGWRTRSTFQFVVSLCLLDSRCVPNISIPNTVANIESGKTPDRRAFLVIIA